MYDKTCKNVVAIGSIFLGKKCYLDVLVDEKKTDLIDTHIRLKGIGDKTVKYTANKLYNHKSQLMNIIHLYYDMYNSKEIEFDLLCDMTEIKFKTFDLTVKTFSEFTRKLKF